MKFFLNKKIKLYFKILLSLFVLSATYGILKSVLNPDQSVELIQSFAEKISVADQLSPTFLFLFIFFNNTFISLTMILGGFFFGILPVLIVFFNGELIGVIFGITFKIVGPVTFFLSVAPHGIFEIPAVILSASLGLYIGTEVIKLLFNRSELKKAIKLSIKTFSEIIVPFLFVAAIIETLLTVFLDKI